MSYAVQNAAPQPTLQHVVADLDGRSLRVIVFSGVVTVAPAQQRGHRRAHHRRPAGRADRLLRAGGVRRALDGAIAVAEATLTQVVVDGRTQMATAYGIADVTVRLVESEQTPGKGWPYLSFTCHSNDLALGVHYRVTIQHPEPTRSPSPDSRPPLEAD